MFNGDWPPESGVYVIFGFFEIFKKIPHRTGCMGQGAWSVELLIICAKIVRMSIF
jgi:hypothetical protein